jgi:type IV pilus assembly protein PilW
MKLSHLSGWSNIPRLSRQAGRTLLELMIAITIGLVVVGAALAIYAGTTGSSRVSETEARLNENAAITLGLLQQQIRLAGYSAIVGPPSFGLRKNMDGVGSAGIRGCTGGISSVTSTVAFSSIACNNVTTSSDALVVRYEADTNNTIPVGTGASAQPSNCVGEGIAITTVSSATATGSTLTMAKFALADNRYYVQTTGTPSGGPELYCVGSTGFNTVTNTVTYGTPQPIMEGVERLDLSFGVAGTTTGTVTVAYMSAQGIDTNLSTETDRWKRILTVRVCLLLRNTASSDQSSRSAITDTSKYYDCSNTQRTSTDGYLRRAYTSTILLKNRLQQ